MEDSAKIAFVTISGLYEFMVMPFGFIGATAMLQHPITTSFKGRVHFAYLDDLIVYSESWKEHIEHLGLVLHYLQEAGLTANPKKCQFAATQSVSGSHCGQWTGSFSAIQAGAVEICREPGAEKQVRAVLGFAGYYRRFIVNFAEIVNPFNRSDKKQVLCTEDWDMAFTQL